MNVSTLTSIVILSFSLNAKSQMWPDFKFPYCKNDSTVAVCHDNQAFERLKGGWTLVRHTGWERIGNWVGMYQPSYLDLTFYDDSVSLLNYPCEYRMSQRVLFRPDTILTINSYPDDYHTESIEWIEDTLVLVQHWGGTGLDGDRHYYLRKNIPKDSLVELKGIITDLNCLKGNWFLSQNNEIVADVSDSTQNWISYYDKDTGAQKKALLDFLPTTELDFGTPESPNFSFVNDTISMVVDGVDLQFKLGQSAMIRAAWLDLIPITQCKCSELNLTYFNYE